jgi:peptide/nickel transport system permease protein
MVVTDGPRRGVAAPSSTARRVELARVLRHRVAQALGVVIAVSTVSFLIVQSLPGDIAYRIAAGRYGYDQVTSAGADLVREELGLDRPVWQQLLTWWGDLARFDLGESLVTGRPVTEELGFYLGATLLLVGAALVGALVLGGALGVLAGSRPGGIVDRGTTVWVAVTRAVPPFLLGLLLIVVVSVQMGVLPASGHGQRGTLVLPAATLALSLSGLFARVTRDTVAQIQASEYVAFAATKGLGRTVLLRRHVARNAGVTLLAYLGVQALVLVEGVLVVELVFAWPGLGHALVHAVFWRDIPTLQAATLVLGLLVVVINTIVDLGVLVLDPRPRHRVAA